jgi:hypothetical protein
VTARSNELLSVPHTNQGENRVEGLREKLLDRVRSILAERILGNSFNPETHRSIIREAAMLRDIPMLEFFDLLLTREHGTDLLRIVFVHATNFDIPLTSITFENVEAYKRMTERIFDSHGVTVTGAIPEISNHLIRMVLGSQHDAAVALRFIDEHGNSNPEMLFQHLAASEGILPVLTDGVL